MPEQMDADEIRAAREADEEWFKKSFLPIAIPAAVLFFIFISSWIVLGFAKGSLFTILLVSALAGGFWVYRFFKERNVATGQQQQQPSVPGYFHTQNDVQNNSLRVSSSRPPQLGPSVSNAPSIERRSHSVWTIVVNVFRAFGRCTQFLGRYVALAIVGIVVISVLFCLLILIASWQEHRNVKAEKERESLQAHAAEEALNDEGRRLAEFIRRQAAWPPPEKDRLFLGMALATRYTEPEAVEILLSVLTVDEMNPGREVLKDLINNPPAYKSTLLILLMDKKIGGRTQRHCSDAGFAVISYQESLRPQDKAKEAQRNRAQEFADQILKQAISPPSVDLCMLIGMAMAESYANDQEIIAILDSVILVNNQNQELRILETLANAPETFDNALTRLATMHKVNDPVLRHCSEAGKAVLAYKKKPMGITGAGDKPGQRVEEEKVQP